MTEGIYQFEPKPAPEAEPAPAKTREPGLGRRALWWCAGVTPEIILRPDCASDWGRQSALGAVTLATALVATVSASVVAYAYVLDQRLAPALLAGGAWGLTILSIDRLLLSSMAKRPDQSAGALLWLAAPRMALAGLLALTISGPAELILFRHQLAIQAALDHEGQILAQKRQIDRRYADLPVLRAEAGRLSVEVEEARRSADGAAAQAICEADGTCGSGRRGAGILHAEKLERSRRLADQSGRIEAVDQARIVAIEARTRPLEAAREADIAGFQRVAASGDDLLSRFLALRHLEADPRYGSTVTAAKWLITLISLALELTPLFTKIFTRGAYDAAFLADRDGACARWDAIRQSQTEASHAQLDRERQFGRSVQDATGALMHQAVADAIESPAADAARAELAREILARSVETARRTAAEVFDDERLRAEIAAAALAARRSADPRVVEAERRRRSAFDAFAGLARRARGQREDKIAADPADGASL
ncbi:MAG TPA: DUF4407 domain-containing protein [Caulobacteraceae bacterium]|nr:DUF4407 domain-containing protein [Caulobacteraceae bacterium]